VIHERYLTTHFHTSVKEKILHTRYVLTLWTALDIGGALIAGSTNALGQADEKTPINDTWLTAKPKIALAADGQVKGRQIDVVTTKNVVMLRGKVDSDAAKQAAEDITKMLDGVKTVKNDLKGVAPAKREAVEEKDQAITTRVQKKIAKDSSEASRYCRSDQCGGRLADRRGQGFHDQCQCVLDGLVRTGREVSEE
jgi:hypothetical protein